LALATLVFVGLIIGPPTSIVLSVVAVLGVGILAFKN
jgi:hypothetical protein